MWDIPKIERPREKLEKKKKKLNKPKFTSFPFGSISYFKIHPVKFNLKLRLEQHQKSQVESTKPTEKSILKPIKVKCS